MALISTLSLRLPVECGNLLQSLFFIQYANRPTAPCSAITRSNSATGRFINNEYYKSIPDLSI